MEYEKLRASLYRVEKLQYYMKSRLTRAKDYSHDTPEISFLRACPYFLSNKCNSVGWGNDSPCWKCVKEGNYNIKNAETKSDVDVFLQITKDNKCR